MAGTPSGDRRPRDHPPGRRRRNPPQNTGLRRSWCRSHRHRAGVTRPGRLSASARALRRRNNTAHCAPERLRKEGTTQMSLLTGGLHHLTIRTTDLARAKRFYVDTIGFQVVRERDGSVLLNAHGTLFGLPGAAPETSPDDRFDPFRIGLDHLALAVDNAESLHE